MMVLAATNYDSTALQEHFHIVRYQKVQVGCNVTKNHVFKDLAPGCRLKEAPVMIAEKRNFSLFFSFSFQRLFLQHCTPE